MTANYFKNPNRGKQEVHKPYQPNYQKLGINPHPIDSEAHTMFNNGLTKNAPFVAKTTKPKPQMPKVKNIPYAESTMEDTSKVPSVSVIPNVGNNIESTWVGLDEALIDENGQILEMENQEGAVIDNNEVDEANHTNVPTVLPVPPKLELLRGFDDEEDTQVISPPQKQATQPETKSSFDEYILVVGGAVLSSGSHDEIEEEVKALIFEEHPLCEERTISVEDISVFKKVKIKIGAFLDG